MPQANEQDWVEAISTKSVKIWSDADLEELISKYRAEKEYGFVHCEADSSLVRKA